MSTGSDLVEQVLDTVQDPSYDEDMVLKLMNSCAVRIAAKILLPALETEAVVIAKAGTSSSSLPVNFQRNLFSCTGCKILNSKEQMARAIITAKTVSAVVATKPLLLFAPSPMADTNLTIGYHRLPGEINADDEVTFLPDGFDDLLVNYALWKLYSMIEQGLEGAKVDTNYYRGLYTEQLEELRLSMKEGVSMPAPPISKGERF